MSKAKITLLDCEYFPCIAWYKSYLHSDAAIIEQYEYFERTSYRNRCEVTGPNGKIVLSVPLERGRNQRTIMKDIRVCNKEKWQQLHWKTLCASYRRAPYFEYYEEELAALFGKQYNYLFELNTDILLLLNKLLKTKKPFNFTASYEKNPGEGVYDLRKAFSPATQIETELPAYVQNFEERNGFIPNLSMLDMLFSCGNKSPEILTGD